MLYSGFTYSSQAMNLEHPILELPFWKSLWNTLFIKVLLLESTYSKETSTLYCEMSSSASKCKPRNSPFLCAMNIQLMSSLLKLTESTFNSLTSSNLIPTSIGSSFVGRPWVPSTIWLRRKEENQLIVKIWLWDRKYGILKTHSIWFNSIWLLFYFKILPAIQTNNRDKRFIFRYFWTLWIQTEYMLEMFRHLYFIF